jgi:hypothetical protein
MLFLQEDADGSKTTNIMQHSSIRRGTFGDSISFGSLPKMDAMAVATVQCSRKLLYGGNSQMSLLTCPSNKGSFDLNPFENRTYTITGFGESVCKQTFELRSGEETCPITVERYFKETYNVETKDKESKAVNIVATRSQYGLQLNTFAFCRIRC